MTERMTDAEFDEYFDNGGDVTEFIVPGSARRPNADDSARKVNVSMPSWMVAELDRTARHLAVSRQAVINMWIAERLAAERK